MAELQELAFEIGADERTLRRATREGTIRGRRPSPRRLLIERDERSYLRSHWQLLAALRRILRTEPNVRFCVLYGSAARGEETAGSDLDLVVEFAKRDRAGFLRLEHKLRSALKRPVQILHFADLKGSPELLAEVVRDGRVIVDRAKRWPALQRRRRSILRQGEEATRRLFAEEKAALDYFEREAGRA